MERIGAVLLKPLFRFPTQLRHVQGKSHERPVLLRDSEMVVPAGAVRGPSEVARVHDVTDSGDSFEGALFGVVVSIFVQSALIAYKT